MALDRLTKVDGGGISTTSDYRVGIITASKFVGPIEGDVTGSITATDGTFSGNVTIGGTLTYEDVTNIDSVGIITARDGIDCNADLDVDGHTNLDNVSIAGVTTHNEDVWFKGATSGRDVYWDKSANELRFNDNANIYVGSNRDAFFTHDGSSTRLQDLYGHLFIGGNLIQIKSGYLTEEYARMDNTSKEVKLFHNSIEKFTTKSTGIVVHGTTTTTGLGVTSLAVAGISTFSGGVGIGTVIPDHNLHVYQEAGDAVITIDSTGNGSHSALEFKRTTSGGDSKGAGSIYVSGNTNATEAKMQFGVGHNISHGQLPRMTIMGNGEVGIGEDNPDSLLHISADSGQAQVRLQRTGAAANGNDYGRIYFESNDNVLTGQISVARESAENNGYMLFKTASGGTLGERLRISSTGTITTTQSFSNIGLDLHATGNGYGSQIKFHNNHGVAYIGQAGDVSGNFLIYNETNTPMLFYSGAVNTLNLYSSREARFSGYVVAQTMGSGTSANTASFAATQSGMNADTYNYILSASNDQGNKCTMFVNGSNRSADGGTNTLTFRNDAGNLRLGHSSYNTYIHGNTTFEAPIINQQTKFQYSNSGGVGAYLSLFNTSATAGSSTGISFGIGNSDAQLDGGDWGEGQIKVYTDSGQYGNMEFNLHTGVNRSYLKIVGNGGGFSGAGAGTEGMTGGVAFGNAGIAIDRSWTGQPGIHVFNTNNVGDTDQGTFRFHGWNRSYASYPASSGGDFGVSLVADGMSLTSDRRRKTGITTITDALNTVSQMRGVSFTYVNRDLEPQTHMSMDNGKKLGFIAQEVIPLLPELILDSGEKAVELENGYCDRYNMDYGGVTPLLVEAIKELKTKNEALEARIAALEGS